MPVVADRMGDRYGDAGLRVLVFAPLARNAEVLCQTLTGAGLGCDVCADVAALIGGVRGGPGAVLLTEEALTGAAVAGLSEVLREQPAWSDVPVLILASGERLVPAGSRAVAALRAVGNIILLERPARGLALVTSLQSALRARWRQYEVRDLMVRESAARVEAEHMAREAERANHLKDEFLATVSHELQTPLSAILLWARLAGSGRVSEKEMPTAIWAIEQSASAQSRLIDDLLDASQMIAGKLRLNPRDGQLEPATRAAVDVVQPSADAKGVSFLVSLDPAAGVVLADPDRIQQVVWNLLANAVKFTPAGGEVRIELGRVGGAVHVVVSDTGRGISAEFLPHMFERFRQADASSARAQGGLGLGLAITRQLVELHGGTITAESEGEGRGAVFTVRLPLVRAGAARAAEEAGRRVSGSGGRGET